MKSKKKGKGAKSGDRFIEAGYRIGERANGMTDGGERFIGRFTAKGRRRGWFGQRNRHRMSAMGIKTTSKGKATLIMPLYEKYIPKEVLERNKELYYVPFGDMEGSDRGVTSDDENWAIIIAYNYNEGIDTNLYNQMIEACRDLGYPIDDMDERWQYWLGGDEVSAEDVLYMFSGMYKRSKDNPNNLDDVRYVFAQDGKWHKIYPGDRDYEMWGLTKGEMTKKKNKKE